MSSTRRFHRKSRNGCTECKARRVKCDELFPACTHCQRSGATCTYSSSSGPRSREVTKPPQSPASSSAQSHEPDQHQHQHQNALPGVAKGVTASPSTAFDLVDLGLMHHYTQVASVRLFPSASFRQVWQDLLPKEAVSRPLLMHGLLSISAMDYAHSNPGPSRDQYRTRAILHQQTGIRIFKTKLSLPPSQAKKEESPSLFVFAAVLAILAFAFPNTSNTPPDIDGILNLLNLLRGCRIVWLQDQAVVASSPLAASFTSPEATAPLTIRPEVHAAFSALLSSPIIINATDENDVNRTAALDLLANVERFASIPSSFSAVGRWPTMVSEAFWERLKAHDPKSLVILAYFSVLLAGFHGFHGLWWTEGWDRMLVGAIEGALSEEERREVGWDGESLIRLAKWEGIG